MYNVVGDDMEILIDRLDHQGRGIGYINDKITFVENALPGEVVDVEIIKQNKKINEAIVKKYIKTSDKRINSICPYYEKCGGCNILHLSYEEQLKYKENKIKEIMLRYASIDEDKIKPIIGSAKNINYRNKVTLKCNGKIGYHQRRTNDIVSIDYCFLANDKINNVIKELSKFDIEKEVDEIIIRDVNEDDLSLTLSLQTDKFNEKKFEKYKKLADSLTFKASKKTYNLSGKSKIIGRLGEKKYKISSESFFQVNTLQTVSMYDKVLDYVKMYDKPKVLDLYCGTGTIGIYISDYAKEVLGVEINPSAIKDAEINKELNGIKNIDFIVGDTKKVLHKNNFQADIVIVDPPRAGLDKEVIDDLFKINSNVIIYVSCDPITLARDLKLLNEKYEVKEITPLDMFPNTYHVETIVLLSREKVDDYIRISVHTKDLQTKAN